MSATDAQITAGAAAAKMFLDKLIEDKAGMFASTVEGDFDDDDIRALVKDAADAMENAG